MTELLTVLCTAGVLGALLTGAVQESRELARKNTCQNQLKRIGLAMLNYSELFNCVPPGWIQRLPQADSPPGYGWQVCILPFVEHADVYNVIDFNAMPSRPTAALKTAFADYRCPSDPTEKTNTMRGDFGTSNYSGNFGPVAPPRWAPGPTANFWPGAVDTPSWTDGVFWRNSNMQARSIGDGTSNTFAVGERCVTSAAGIWAGVTANRNESDAVTDCSAGNEINSGLAAFSSMHEGGANFLFFDGSVRFISSSIKSSAGEGAEMGLYQRLSARNDGQEVDGF